MPFRGNTIPPPPSGATEVDAAALDKARLEVAKLATEAAAAIDTQDKAQEEANKTLSALKEARRQGEEAGIKEATVRKNKSSSLVRQCNSTYGERSKSKTKCRSLQMKSADLKARKKQHAETSQAQARLVQEKTSQLSQRKRRVAGANGLFPDPFPAKLNGICLLHEGTGYRSTEVVVRPPKFGDSNLTAVQFINTAVGKARNEGMPNSTILQKFVNVT